MGALSPLNEVGILYTQKQFLCQAKVSSKNLKFEYKENNIIISTHSVPPARELSSQGLDNPLLAGLKTTDDRRLF